jgi:hypothetical protein
MNNFNKKVSGFDGLSRNPDNNSIINTNKSDYEEYLRKRKNKQNENNRIRDIESNIDSVKDELNEIKNILKSLLGETLK